MRKRPGVEFHRLDAHQTRKQHGEERKKKNYYPSLAVPTSQPKLYRNSSNKSKLPPKTDKHHKHRPHSAHRARKAPKYSDGEAKNADLRLTLLGLGCLRRDIVARMMMIVVVGAMMMMMNSGDGG